MNTYRILNQNREYKTIQYNQTPILKNIGKIIWDDVQEISSYHYTWDKNNNSKFICDCPFIIGSVPVFSEFAYNKISTFLDTTNSQVIPIIVDDRKFYIVNAIILMDNMLNEKKSKISYFSDGRIMDIDKYVLNNRPTPDLFKLSQFHTYTFVSEKIVDILKSEVTGIVFEKCNSNNILSLLGKYM